jgi:hypothetical protein
LTYSDNQAATSGKGKIQMTIDERLDRLTERHEALTESVELLLRNSQSVSRSIESLLATSQNLIRLAENHERRISKMEGGD